MKYLLAAAAMTMALAVTPASAKMMSCTGENMAKSATAASMMADGPQKTGMMKEMAMANTAMSQGDMRSACKSYMRAQKMGMMNSGM